MNNLDSPESEMNWVVRAIFTIPSIGDHGTFVPKGVKGNIRPKKYIIGVRAEQI